MNDAPALLRRYDAHSLLDEYAQWERARAELKPNTYTRPAEPEKWIIALDGIPGAGKSTTLRWLEPALGATYFSMARFAERHGVSADTRRQHQLSTGRPHSIDEKLIDAIAACPSKTILLEKFPRSVVEATAVIEAARRWGWRIDILHLYLPGDCVALSTERQIARGPRHGRMPEPDYAQHRALVHLARATSGRETLRSAGVPIHAFDTTRPVEETQGSIRRALGIDFQSEAWHWPTLETLEQVSRRLGIDAWAASGSVYRSFWNGRFGPPQLPTDIDVAVQHQRDEAPLLEALEAASPEVRWSVLCPGARLAKRYGIETDSVFEAKSHTTFLHRSGVVRLRDGRIELQLPDGAESCLRNGVIALNDALLRRLSSSQRALLLQRETHHLPRALADYPGVSVHPATAALLEDGPHWPVHEPQPIKSTFKALKAEVLLERPCKSLPRARRALASSELVVAQRVLEFQRQAERSAQPPPLPPKRALPRRSGGLRRLGRSADDADFGAWFLNQFHHHRPVGGADGYLRSLLDFSLFQGALSSMCSHLGPMHQGWSLGRHLAFSVLQLKTDGCLDRLRTSRSAEQLADLRLCMRFAMMFHDTGKLVGKRPRRHGEISAALFARFRPAWFPERLVPMTQWMIRTHDVFGLLGRGLSDKRGHEAADYAVSPSEETSYPAALDVQAARARLVESGLPLPDAVAIHGALWAADVGSIAALRWLLPVAPLLEQLVLTPAETSTYSGVERRRAQS